MKMHNDFQGATQCTDNMLHQAYSPVNVRSYHPVIPYNRKNIETSDQKIPMYFIWEKLGYLHANFNRYCSRRGYVDPKQSCKYVTEEKTRCVKKSNRNNHLLTRHEDCRRTLSNSISTENCNGCYSNGWHYRANNPNKTLEVLIEECTS